MEENNGYSQIIGSSQAPYINTLASQGALFTNSSALTHPSQPNYLDLFSGSDQGVTSDSCPHTFSVASLESELNGAGKSFKGYSEGLRRRSIVRETPWLCCYRMAVAALENSANYR